MGHFFGGVTADPLQDIHQIVVGMDIVQAAGTDQALNDSQMTGAQLAPAKEPVLSVMLSST